MTRAKREKERGPNHPLLRYGTPGKYIVNKVGYLLDVNSDPHFISSSLSARSRSFSLDSLYVDLKTPPKSK